VTFNLPGGASKRDAKGYVHDAVLEKVGSQHIDDPLFALKRGSVRARNISNDLKLEATSKYKDEDFNDYDQYNNQ